MAGTTRQHNTTELLICVVLATTTTAASYSTHHDNTPSIGFTTTGRHGNAPTSLPDKKSNGELCY